MDRIRAARQRRGLSQAELAAELRVSQRSVGSWERGEEISPSNRAKLRDYFGSELDEPSPAQATVGAPATDEIVVVLARKLAEAERELATLRERLARSESPAGIDPDDERLIDLTRNLTHRQREVLKAALTGDIPTGTLPSVERTGDEWVGSSERLPRDAGTA
jgi:transcriptional regulator with XRE-family HTH domain